MIPVGVPGNIHHIGHHSGGGGQLARAAAVEHHIAHGVSGDRDGVEHILHTGQGVLTRDQVGGHKGAHLALRLPDGPAQQLDLIAAGVSIGHIGQAHSPDALGGNLVGIDVLPKRQGGQDAGLAAGVVTVHVGGGVLLGIAVGLSLLQSLVEGESRLDHPGEDVVGGAVEDTGDLIHLIGGQAGIQGPQDGDSTAHAGLEQIADAVLLGQLQQLIAVGGYQLLVGRDHALSGLQGTGGVVQGSAYTADGLHHDAHLGVMLDRREVLDKQILVRALKNIPGPHDVFQPDLVVHPSIDQSAVLGQHLSHTGTHSPEAQNRYIYHSVHLILHLPAILTGQDLAFQHTRTARRRVQHILQRALEGRGLRRDGHHRAAVDRDVLIDGQDVDPRSGKDIEQSGQDPRLILQHRLKGDDPSMEHIVEGTHRVLVLVIGTAADAHSLSCPVHRGLLACLQKALGLRHLAEDLRHGRGLHNKVSCRLFHSASSIPRHFVRPLRPFVFVLRSILAYLSQGCNGETHSTYRFSWESTGDICRFFTTR